MYQDKSSSPPKQIQVITKDKSFSPQPWSRHRCPHRQLSSVEKCCRPWRSDCRSVALDYVNIFWSPIIRYWNRTLDEYFIISSPIGKDVLSLIDHLDGLVKGLKWHEHMFLLDVNAFLHCTEHEFFSWNWWYDRIAGERVRFNICFKFTRCRFIDRLGICHRCISNIKYRSRDVWHNLIWYDLVTANIQNIFKLSGPGLSGIFVLCHDKDNGFDNLNI